MSDSTEPSEFPRSIFNPKYSAMPGEFMYNGNLWAAWTSTEYIQLVENKFQFLPTDILLSGYAKSGITLLSEIICLLVYCKGKLDLLQSAIERVEKLPIYLRVPFIEERWRTQYPGMNKEAQAMEYLDFLRTTGSDDPRIIKTHLPYDSIECAFRRTVREDRPRVIYVYRNPKDAAISMYNFYRGLRDCGPFKGSWDDFFEMWIDGWVSGGDWRKVVPTWLSKAKSQELTTILPISYEMMVKEPATALNYLHSFLFPGTELNSTVCEVIMERTNFEKMRANRMTNYEKIPEFVPTFRFMRRGQVGDWKTWFTSEQDQRFAAAYVKTLEQLEQILSPESMIFQ